MLVEIWCQSQVSYHDFLNLHILYCTIKLEDGYLWEEGPNSFQPNIAILRLAKDLNMLDELVLADPSLPRFIYWNKDLHALPSSIHDILNFNLLSCMFLLRLFMNWIY